MSSQYRDDGAAAHLRVRTLEAQLAERDASLRAREAELAEERERLRVCRAQAAPSDRALRASGRQAVAAGQAVALGATLCFGVCASLLAAMPRRLPAPPAAPHRAAGLHTTVSPAPFGATAWGRAHPTQLTRLAALCAEVGDEACVSAVRAEQQRRAASADR